MKLTVGLGLSIGRGDKGGPNCQVNGAEAT